MEYLVLSDPLTSGYQLEIVLFKYETPKGQILFISPKSTTCKFKIGLRWYETLSTYKPCYTTQST